MPWIQEQWIYAPFFPAGVSVLPMAMVGERSGEVDTGQLCRDVTQSRAVLVSHRGEKGEGIKCSKKIS